MITGSQFDRTYRSGDKFNSADLEEQDMQFLYKQAESYHFMNTTSYEQIEMSAEQVGDASNYLTENLVVSILLFQERPIGISLPNFVEQKVIKSRSRNQGRHRPPGRDQARYHGDGFRHPGYLFSSKRAKTLRIDTRTGSYVERVKVS